MPKKYFPPDEAKEPKKAYVQSIIMLSAALKDAADSPAPKLGADYLLQ